MAKKFVLPQRVSMQLKLGAYNVPNRVNLLEPVTDLHNNNSGRSVDPLNPKAQQAYPRLSF